MSQEPCITEELGIWKLLNPEKTGGKDNFRISKIPKFLVKKHRINNFMDDQIKWKLGDYTNAK